MREVSQGPSLAEASSIDAWSGAPLNTAVNSPQTELFRIDVVPTDALPSVPHHIPYNDLDQLLRSPIGKPLKSRDGNDNLPPRPRVTDPEESLINTELLTSFARLQAAHKLRFIIRGGGSYDKHREGRSPEQFEALAVHGMGLDFSLYYHGAEQARRISRLMRMNQAAHEIMHQVIQDNYVQRGVAARAYRAFGKQVPNFTALDVEEGEVCGVAHDNGEAKNGVDKVFDRKDREYEACEAAACVAYTMELHTPMNDRALMRLLKRRVESRTNPRKSLSSEQQAEASYYLHPLEVTKSIYKTEPSEVFKGATEPMEYVLEGIRAFEGVEYNLAGISEDKILAPNLLRLGVSTFYNSLYRVCRMAEKYVALYDFLRQNEGVINRYVDIMTYDIESHYAGHPGYAKDIFSTDPFTNYDLGKEPISADEARMRFLEMAKLWREWQTKNHLVRILWENHFGTTHDLTVNNPDVSFLQYTARNTYGMRKKVPVLRPLKDMFGVSLDPISRSEHEAKVLQAAGIA